MLVEDGRILWIGSGKDQNACLPPKVNSVEELVKEIAKAREDLKGSRDVNAPLPWIRGWGYDERKYREKRSPERRYFYH